MTTAMFDLAAAPAADILPSERCTKILLVEDDNFLRSILAESLRESRYEVVEAGDGFEAQNLTEGRSAFQMLVTDFEMPGMNGMELAGWFQAANPRADILITTGSRPKVEDFAGGSSPYPILEKPYTDGQLKRKIGEMLASHPVRQETE